MEKIGVRLRCARINVRERRGMWPRRSSDSRTDMWLIGYLASGTTNRASGKATRNHSTSEWPAVFG